MEPRSLNLLLTDLKAPECGEWPSLPAMQRLLSKGRRRHMEGSLSDILCRHFSLKREEGADLPVAALSALGDGLDAASGWWLRADPVHLVPDRDQLYLSASASLALSRDEADVLIESLNQLYAEEGWTFIAATPQRWYLCLPKPLRMQTVPTQDAMGRRVGEILPQGDDALSWQRVMTEIQMVLHNHPINLQRHEQGLLAINGLWFWGGGCLPQCEGQTDWDSVVADDPLTLGLARLHGVSTDTVASVTLHGAMRSAKRALWQVSITSFEELERAYGAPLLEMLRGGELSRLVIELPGLARWVIDRASLRHWWRWPRSLQSLLGGIGELPQ